MSSVAEKLGTTKKREKADLTPEEKKRRRNKGIIKAVAVIAIVIFGSWGFFEGMKLVAGTQYPVVVVVSGSMEPNILKGDILFVHYVPPADIKNGTIEDKNGSVILYNSVGLWEHPESEPIVHRVVGKRFDNDTQMWYFLTKGDHNLDVDPPDCFNSLCPNTTDDEIIEVPEDHIVGVVWGRIPYIGWVKIWLQDTNIAIPLLVIIGIALVISIVWDALNPEEETKRKKQSKKRGEVLATPKEILPELFEEEGIENALSSQKPSSTEESPSTQATSTKKEDFDFS
ncbi:MAG: hypothetical protein RBG13Loki_4335 [Promethearchaeota archaeon CR_4]|nr:MAG: hypothetical protein RBG13Loki_4335 [Candidatus Lokiarchaeota archaeon CR_4]